MTFETIYLKRVVGVVVYELLDVMVFVYINNKPPSYPKKQTYKIKTNKTEQTNQIEKSSRAYVVDGQMLIESGPAHFDGPDDASGRSRNGKARQRTRK